MTLWPWKREASHEGYVEPEPVPAVEKPNPHAAVFAKRDELKVLVVAIEAELSRMKAEAAENIEKPAGPYRIIKFDLFDNSPARAGYFVQEWRVKQYGWSLYGRSLDFFGEGIFRYQNSSRQKAYDAEGVSGDLLRLYTIPQETIAAYSELREFEEALKWENAPRCQTFIHWENVGSANPHPTYEAAEDWLKKWLRPEFDEVIFDAEGNRIAKGGLNGLEDPENR